MRTLENPITVEVVIGAPVSTVWTVLTEPQHITHWNFASEDWSCPTATNDLRQGGSFSYRMEAKDGSFGFDFGGEYTEVRTNEYIESTMGDGRGIQIRLQSDGSQTTLTELFEAEGFNPRDLQQSGWQAILDNLKRHAESLV